MHRNMLWLGFLSLIAFCVLGYTGFTLMKVYEYYSLSTQVPVRDISWEVVKEDEDKFVPQAKYRFLYKGKEYGGEAAWDEYALNKWSAGEMIKTLKNQSYQAWIYPSNPDYSTLQKKFPIKQCLSSVTLWFIFLYFITLGRYVRRFQNE